MARQHNGQLAELLQAATEEIGSEGTHMDKLAFGDKVALAAMNYLAASVIREIQTIKAAVSLPIWLAAAGLVANLAWRVFEIVVLHVR